MHESNAQMKYRETIKRAQMTNKLLAFQQGYGGNHSVNINKKM